MIVREIVDPNGAVLVHRELESGVPFVRVTGLDFLYQAI